MVNSISEKEYERKRDLADMSSQEQSGNMQGGRKVQNFPKTFQVHFINYQRILTSLCKIFPRKMGKSSSCFAILLSYLIGDGDDSRFFESETDLYGDCSLSV